MRVGGSALVNQSHEDRCDQIVLEIDQIDQVAGDLLCPPPGFCGGIQTKAKIPACGSELPEDVDGLGTERGSAMERCETSCNRTPDASSGL